MPFRRVFFASLLLAGCNAGGGSDTKAACGPSVVDPLGATCPATTTTVPPVTAGTAHADEGASGAAAGGATTAVTAAGTGGAAGTTGSPTTEPGPPPIDDPLNGRYTIVSATYDGFSCADGAGDHLLGQEGAVVELRADKNVSVASGETLALRYCSGDACDEFSQWSFPSRSGDGWSDGSTQINGRSDATSCSMYLTESTARKAGAHVVLEEVRHTTPPFVAVDVGAAGKGCKDESLVAPHRAELTACSRLRLELAPATGPAPARARNLEAVADDFAGSYTVSAFTENRDGCGAEGPTVEGRIGKMATLKATAQLDAPSGKHLALEVCGDGCDQAPWRKELEGRDAGGWSHVGLGAGGKSPSCTLSRYEATVVHDGVQVVYEERRRSSPSTVTLTADEAAFRDCVAPPIFARHAADLSDCDGFIRVVLTPKP